MSSTIMTTAEAARFLDVVPATVRAYQNSGLLPADRTVTGVRIFHVRDVEAFAKSRAENIVNRRRSTNG